MEVAEKARVGSSGVGRCVLGLCVMEVTMDGSTNGNLFCQAEGLNCIAYPVFLPPTLPCKVFHPDASRP